MDNKELDKLEALAKAAEQVFTGMHWYTRFQILDGISNDESAAFIGALDPGTVLELIAQARAAAPAPHAQAADDDLLTVFADAAKRALRAYRMSNMVCSPDDPCDAYPLVDLLSTEGETIATGEHEIDLIVDAIWNEARAALASQPAPVLPAEKVKAFKAAFHQASAQGAAYDEAVAVGLAAALSQQPLQAAIPEGYKLVPLEPTIEMMDGAFENISLSDAHTTYGVERHVWDFMLARAPQPPAVASVCRTCNGVGTWIGQHDGYDDADCSVCDGAAIAARSLAAPTATAEPATFPKRDLSKPAEQQGLFRKFDVRRVDGSDQPGGKHYGCRYFVLDLNHDQHAPAAMRAYAASCRATHPQLADDIEGEFAAPAPQQAPLTDARIRELYREHVLPVAFARAIERELSASAVTATTEQDAARYHWLRDNMRFVDDESGVFMELREAIKTEHHDVHRDWQLHLWDASVDATVDAAMAAAPTAQQEGD